MSHDALPLLSAQSREERMCKSKHRIPTKAKAKRNVQHILENQRMEGSLLPLPLLRRVPHGIRRAEGG